MSPYDSLPNLTALNALRRERLTIEAMRDGYRQRYKVWSDKLDQIDTRISDMIQAMPEDMTEHAQEVPE